FSTAALADPTVIAAGDAVTIEGPDGTTNKVALDALPAPVHPGDIVAALNTAWAAFNVSASLTTAADGGTVGRLRLRANAAGYDQYFILSGTATGGGRPLDGMAVFAQGKGAAIGATAKSKVADPGGTFDLSAANNKLTVTVHGDALPDIDLTGTATDPIDGVVAKIDAAFRAPAVNGLAAVRRLGNRILISTANLGSADNALDVTGVA